MKISLVWTASVMVYKKQKSYFNIWKIGGRRLSQQEEPARLLSLWIRHCLEQCCRVHVALPHLGQPELELHSYESIGGRLEALCVGVDYAAPGKCSPYPHSPFACVWGGFSHQHRVR